MTALLALSGHSPTVIAVGDAFRIACCVLAAVLIGLSAPMVLFRYRNRNAVPQRQDVALLVIAFSMLCISALMTEVEQYGKVVTFRLLFNVLGVALGALAVWRLTHSGASR